MIWLQTPTPTPQPLTSSDLEKAIHEMGSQMIALVDRGTGGTIIAFMLIVLFILGLAAIVAWRLGWLKPRHPSIIQMPAPAPRDDSMKDSALLSLAELGKQASEQHAIERQEWLAIAREATQTNKDLREIIEKLHDDKKASELILNEMAVNQKMAVAHAKTAAETAALAAERSETAVNTAKTAVDVAVESKKEMIGLHENRKLELESYAKSADDNHNILNGRMERMEIAMNEIKTRLASMDDSSIRRSIESAIMTFLDKTALELKRKTGPLAKVSPDTPSIIGGATS